MKNTKYISFAFLLIFIFHSNSSDAQALKSFMNKTVFMPGVLVENELTPELYTVGYQTTLVDGIYKSELTNKPEVKVRQSNITIAPAYALTFINKMDHQLYFGGGFSRTTYSEESGATINTPLESNNSIYLQTYLSTKIANKWYISSFAQLSDNETKSFKDFSNGFNQFVLGKINFHPNQHWNIGAGAFYNSNNGSPQVLPTISIHYGSKKHVVSVDFPRYIQYEYLIKEGKIRPVIGMWFSAFNYLDNVNTFTVSAFGQRAIIGVRYRVLDFLYFYLEGSRMLNQQIQSGSIGDIKKVGSYGSDLQIKASLSVQLSKYYRQ
jgi:hypothetical protein